MSVFSKPYTAILMKSIKKQAHTYTYRLFIFLTRKKTSETLYFGNREAIAPIADAKILRSGYKCLFIIIIEIKTAC